MRKAPIILASLLIILGFGAYVKAYPSGIGNEPKIIFLGDSRTAGGVLSNPAEQAYPALVADLLNWNTVNAGCGGATTRDFIYPNITTTIGCHLGNAWDLLVQNNFPADYGHIFLGGNDASGFNENLYIYMSVPIGSPPRWVNETEFLGNIIRIIDRFSENHAQYTFVSYEPELPAAYDLFFNGNSGVTAYDLAIRYREMITEAVLLHPNACFGVDLFDALIYPDDFADGVHPNAQGHAKMADLIADRLDYVTSAPTHREFMKRCKEVPNTL